YDTDGNVLADFTSNDAVNAPNLPSSGIPWMVPHSDYFNSDILHPEWSFSGYTPDHTHSITERPGWLRLSPRGKANTVVKHEAEHNYSLITRLDFNPESPNDQAGFWLFNGLETLYAKLNSTVNDSGKSVISFSFTDGDYYEAENSIGDTLWLKFYRDNHMLSAYFGSDGHNWSKIGEDIDVSAMDKNQPNYNGWIGTQLGLYVQGKSADFDFFIYRDAYSPIKAQPAANQFGTLRSVSGIAPAFLDSIDNNDWALYAGVEFGGKDYYIKPDSLEISASCASSGGIVEVWLDSIDTGQKIAECPITNTGSLDNFMTFKTAVDSTSGMHDVYLRFLGSGKLFVIDWFKFIGTSYSPPVGIKEEDNFRIQNFTLYQNYPNPFNPVTVISWQLAVSSYVDLSIYNILGQKICTLVSEKQNADKHKIEWNASSAPSGVYIYKLRAGSFEQTKKMILLH
ncbi:MAG TPA: carbohydrate-binding protein, partial [Caldithrix sp.]|nr:carbohydrate-binding protein [Caldithrix sp.]